MNISREVRIGFLLYIFCVALYFLFLSNSVLLVDGYSRFDLTASLAEEGRFVEACRFAPAQSIFQIPLYLAGKLAAAPFSLEDPLYVSKFFVNLINTLLLPLAAVVLYLICRNLKFHKSAATGTALLYAFGTMAFHYARFNAYEPLLSLLLLISCYSLLQYRDRRQPAYFLIFGLTLFLLPLHNNAMFPLVGMIGLFLFFSRKYLRLGFRHFVFLGIVLIASVGGSLYYNFARYGSPWLSGYQSGVGSYDDQGFNPRFYIGIYGLLISPAKSIFLYNPVLILSLLAAGRFFRGRKDRVLTFYILGVSLYFLLLYSSWWSFMGECAWGPRFLFPVIPFLLLPVAALLEEFSGLEGKRKNLIRGVVSLSVVVQLISIVVHFKHFYFVLSPYPGYSRLTSAEGIGLNYQPFFGQFVILFRAFSQPEYFDLRWFEGLANNPLVYGTIISTCAVVAGLSFFCLRKAIRIQEDDITIR